MIIAKNLKKPKQAKLNHTSSDSDASDFSCGKSFSDRSIERARANGVSEQQPNNGGTKTTVEEGRLFKSYSLPSFFV